VKLASWTAAAVLVVAFGYFWAKRKRRVDHGPPESIVLLFREPKHIDNRLLAEVFTEESGTRVDAITQAGESSA
jgi:hypothetical protein